MSNNLIRQESHSELVHSHPALAGGGTAMQVRGQYATAVSVQRPRELVNVDKRLKEEATLAGTSFYYAWGAGRDQIEGPSVKLAMAAVRVWGNCAVELQPVQETRDAWIFTAAFVDLETGYTLSRQFRQDKNWTIHGKFDAARKDDIRFQIGQSKSIRNVILNALPSWLIEHAIEAAKSGVMKGLQDAIGREGIESVRDKILKYLEREGVSEEMVLYKYSRPTVKALTIEDMALMRGDWDALKSRSDTIEHLYPTPPSDEPTKHIGNTADDLADQLEAKAEKPKRSRKSDAAEPEVIEEPPAENIADDEIPY